MKVENWPIERVQPYPGNPRDNDAAVDAVARSIQQFGFRQPIVVDKDEGIRAATDDRNSLVYSLSQSAESFLT